MARLAKRGRMTAQTHQTDTCAGGMECRCGPTGTPDFSCHVDRYPSFLIAIDQIAAQRVPANHGHDADHELSAMIVDVLSAKWAKVENLWAYAQKIAINLAKRSRRAEKIRNSPDDVLTNRRDVHAKAPDEELMEHESLDLNEAELKRLPGCVAQLTPTEKAVIEAYQTGRPYRELARESGISESLFRYRLKRALERLARCMRRSN